MDDKKLFAVAFSAGMIFGIGLGVLLGLSMFGYSGKPALVVGAARPPIGMPNPLPSRNEKAVFGFARMDRDGLTVLRLRAWDGANANWDAKLFGSEEPVPDGGAPPE